MALEGVQHHGIDFAVDALKRGAAAVLCDPGLSRHHDGPSLEAPSALEALSSLARGYRQQDRHQTPALAVTGSVGKTTTCCMIHDLLAATHRVHAPRDSYNNEIGVPITILEAPPETEVLVLEMGTSSVGEIAARTEVAQPSHGVITAISEAHLEGLGTLEAIRGRSFPCSIDLKEISGGHRSSGALGWGSRVPSIIGLDRLATSRCKGSKRMP